MGLLFLIIGYLLTAVILYPKHSEDTIIYSSLAVGTVFGIIAELVYHFLRRLR